MATLSFYPHIAKTVWPFLFRSISTVTPVSHRLILIMCLAYAQRCLGMVTHTS